MAPDAGRGLIYLGPGGGEGQGVSVRVAEPRPSPAPPLGMCGSALLLAFELFQEVPLEVFRVVVLS